MASETVLVAICRSDILVLRRNTLDSGLLATLCDSEFTLSVVQTTCESVPQSLSPDNKELYVL